MGILIQKPRIQSYRVDLCRIQTRRTKPRNAFFLNSRYYKLSQKRFPYVENKTENENMYVLTLLAIANEIIFWAEKEVAKRTGAEKIGWKHLMFRQKLKVLLQSILEWGCRLTIIRAIKRRTSNTTGIVWIKGVTYEYGGYKFNFTLNKIDCYPQDIAAVVTYKPKKSRFYR